MTPIEMSPGPDRALLSTASVAESVVVAPPGSVESTPCQGDAYAATLGGRDQSSRSATDSSNASPEVVPSLPIDSVLMVCLKGPS